MRFVVAGTGRCASTWCAVVLACCGARVGHQAIRHGHVLGEPFDWGDLDGVVSYEAVPILGSLDCRTVLVVRDALAVARSWVGLGVFGDDMADNYADCTAVLERYAPQVLARPDPPRRAVEFWLAWNELALPHADVVLAVEGLTPRRLAEAVGVRWDPLADEVPPTVNRRGERATFGWEAIDDDQRERVAAMSERLGL